MTTHYTFAMELARQRHEQLTGTPKAGRRIRPDQTGTRPEHRSWRWNRPAWPTRPTLRARTA